MLMQKHEDRKGREAWPTSAYRRPRLAHAKTIIPAKAEVRGACTNNFTKASTFISTMRYS
jgi:hypothetical protein